MVEFKVESWTAFAPDMEDKDAWRSWLNNPYSISNSVGKVPLKQFPPMLRRRFSALGKCAMAAALPLLADDQHIPSIFASRHGDTELTLSLQKCMGLNEPMSPTGFSLAVHNAVSGLFSIGRKDTSEVTSIAAMQGLVINALLESIGQLQNREQVLCVVYDICLPDVLSEYVESDPFPYAIAVVLSKTSGTSFYIEQSEELVAADTTATDSFDTEPLRFLKVLSGISDEMTTACNGASWRVSKASDE